MINNSIKIFVDFDGTITKQDVGDSVFLRYCNEQKVREIIDDLLADRISAKECWVKLCQLIDKVDVRDLNEYIDSMEIDPFFSAFCNYCSVNNTPFYVLSDGFDYYIERIFRKEGIEGITFFANRLEVTDQGKFIPYFPYTAEGCRSSANCKRNHIISNSSDDDYTVYIGDGNSDKYVIQFCDYIFAKDDLLKYCERERISYFPYNDFNDVIKRLKELHAKKRLKKRHQAELKRKEVYISE